MKKLYLHIGMGKTGTTALQKFFFQNRRALKKQGICYPEYGAVSHVHHLVSPHVPRYLEGTLDFLPVDVWAPKLARVSEERLLMSSELIAWADEAEVRAFCQEVTRWFELHIVVYLRRQDNIMMASYNQQVKAGLQKRNIKTIVNHLIKRFNYEKILSPWVSELGQDRIKVGVYEKQQFYKNDIRSDFMHHVFGLDLDKTFRFSEENSNPGLTRAISEYKVFINNVVEDVRVNSRLNDLLFRCSEELEVASRGIFSEHSSLSPDLRLEVIEASEDINSKIAREYLGREDGVLFYDPLPVSSGDWAVQALEMDGAMRISRRLVEMDRDLMLWIAGEAERQSNSELPIRRFAAHIVARSIEGAVEA